MVTGITEGVLFYNSIYNSYNNITIFYNSSKLQLPLENPWSIRSTLVVSALS